MVTSNGVGQTLNDVAYSKKLAELESGQPDAPLPDADLEISAQKKSRHVAPSSCHDFILMRDGPCPTLAACSGS